ncbi:MAG: DNA sulfur modification protein DndD, partial [Nitrospirae bacterium]|nr:DNA sulfur modification protein DndD [Nitrospirota bacterium]
MWFSKIELTNFKSYQHQVFSFPKPENGRNIVLIGGLNGYGKTTLLEAIYLCLYGEEAMLHLAIAGVSDDRSYNKYLNNALHGAAHGKGGDISMQVSIIIQIDDLWGYEVKRTWYYRTTGLYSETDVKISEINAERGSNWLTEEDLPDILSLYVVPAHLAPFFFFDGEEIRNKVDQNKKEFILMGMQNLLGVILLRRLRDGLGTYANKKISGMAGDEQDEFERKLLKLSDIEKECSELDMELKQIEEVLQQCSERRDRLLQRLFGLGHGGGDAKQIEGITKDEGNRTNELKLIQDKLDNILGSEMPLLMISRAIYETLDRQLKAEDILQGWQLKKDSLSPQKENFKESVFKIFTSKLVSQGLTITSIDRVRPELESSIDEAWENLYSPPPDGCAQTMLHGYLDDRQILKVQEALKHIILNGVEIRSLMDERYTLKNKIKDLISQRTQIQSLIEGGNLLELLAQREECLKEHETITNKKHEISLKKRAIDTERDQCRATVERERKRLSEMMPKRSYANKAQRVIDFINELMPKLINLKIQEISKAVSEAMHDLTHKGLVFKVQVKESGETHFLDKGDNIIPYELSAGEKQMFATALVAGLARVSGFEIPLVVDTPLGRLDSKHRKRIENFWISTGRQVILLSQDAEIGAEELEQLHEHVGKTYLLEHEV